MFTYAFIVTKRRPFIECVSNQLLNAMNMLSWSSLGTANIPRPYNIFILIFELNTSIYIVPSRTENAIIFIVLPGIGEKVNILPAVGGKHVKVSIHLIKDDRPWGSTQLNITQVELVTSTSTDVSGIPKGLYDKAMVFFSCPIPKKRFSYCDKCL